MPGPSAPVNQPQPHQPGQVPPPGANGNPAGGIPPSQTPELPPDLPPDDGLNLFPQDDGADQPQDPAKQQAQDLLQTQQQAGLDRARAQLSEGLKQRANVQEQNVRANETQYAKNTAGNEAQHEAGRRQHNETRDAFNRDGKVYDKTKEQWQALNKGAEKQANRKGAHKNAQQKALVSHLKQQPGENAGKHLTRLQERAQPSERQVQQALDKLPQDLQKKLGAEGKTQGVKQFLKLKLQMARLQTWQRAAKAQGQAELAGQIGKAMKALATKIDQVPAELVAQLENVELESTETELEETETSEGEDGGEEVGLRDTQRLSTLEGTDQDAQGQGEGHHSQSQAQPTPVIISNAGALATLQNRQALSFVKTDGTQGAEGNAKLRGEFGIFDQMMAGMHVALAGEDGGNAAITRYAGAKHSLSPISFTYQRGGAPEEENLQYDNTETGGSGVRVKTANGRALLPNQIFAMAAGDPEAEFISIAGLQVSRAEVDQLAEFVGIRRGIDAQQTSIGARNMGAAVQHDAYPASVFA